MRIALPAVDKNHQCPRRRAQESTGFTTLRATEHPFETGRWAGLGGVHVASRNVRNGVSSYFDVFFK